MARRCRGRSSRLRKTPGVLSRIVDNDVYGPVSLRAVGPQRMPTLHRKPPI